MQTVRTKMLQKDPKLYSYDNYLPWKQFCLFWRKVMSLGFVLVCLFERYLNYLYVCRTDANCSQQDVAKISKIVFVWQLFTLETILLVLKDSHVSWFCSCLYVWEVFRWFFIVSLYICFVCLRYLIRVLWCKIGFTSSLITLSIVFSSLDTKIFWVSSFFSCYMWFCYQSPGSEALHSPFFWLVFHFPSFLPVVLLHLLVSNTTVHWSFRRISILLFR